MTFDLEPFRDLYPFTSRWLDVDGLRLHYVDEGEGDPVVCVHGNPTWSFYFRDLIRDLRSDYRVLAPDHIGCGLSDKPGDRRYPYVLERRVDDLVAFLDALQLERNVTLIMHDWGGMIGTAAALRRPERIARLVILNTAAFRLPPGKRLPIRLRVVRDLGPIGALMVRGLNAFSVGATKMGTVGRLRSRVRAAYRAPYDNWANRIATLRFVQDIPLRPRNASYALVQWVDEHLHTLERVPKLIAWGERDFVFDRHFLDEWRRRCPEARVHCFRDAGHLCLEDAGDQIAALIRSFLESHRLSPAWERSAP